MKALVTGAGGFLGGAITRQLLRRGAAVRGLARSAYPEMTRLGVDMRKVDIADRGAVLHAAEGCDLVFHVAAKAGVWGSRESYYLPNVVGTQNVIEACRRHGIKRLVYTSTPSVTFDGRDEEGVDESAPYAGQFLCHYAETKAEAEKRVLAANNRDLATVALRPHLIWGPGDNHLVPRIWERGRAGRLRLIDGGKRKVDSVYIDNAVDAHLLAANKLAPGAACAGKAYFISNGEPLPVGELINRILAAAGIPPVTRSVSARTAYVAGAVMEFVFRLLRRRDEPIMTRFVARQLSTAHWFDISAARRDFGYKPRVSMAQGLKRLKPSKS
ncbi:MAG: NAD-dependent epimerase/dehydratase family protein [Planctomycetota bacterium]